MRASIILRFPSVVVLLVPLACNRRFESEANAGTVELRVPPTAQATVPADLDCSRSATGGATGKTKPGLSPRLSIG